VAVTLPAAASAVLLLAAYPLPDIGWAAWVALVPWTVQVLRARRHAIAWTTWPVWLVWWVVMVHWLRFATGLGWLALAVYLSVYFPVAALLLRVLRRRFHLPATLALPVVWVGLEYVRGHLLSGFPWFLLGHTQHGRLALIQIADLVGVAGVTFVVAAVNGLVVDLLVDPIFRRRDSGAARRRARLRPRAVASALVVVALVAGTLIYGRLRLAEGRRTITDGPTVAAIQGNIPQEIKHSGSIEDEIRMLKDHVALTRDVVAQRPDLIVWPETMVPGTINVEYLAHEPTGAKADRVREYIAVCRLFRQEIEALAAEGKAPMLVGNVTTRFDAAGGRHRYNSALLIQPDGRTAARYDKMHLVPFGEYIPLKRTFPWLQDLTPFDYDHTVEPGEEPTVFRAGGARFAVAICFESTVPQVVRRLAYSSSDGKRIDFLVNISNDGWFRASSELPQHLAICTFRAVENRVGVVRAVNTGISAFIDPNGRVVKELERAGRRRGVEGTLVGRVAVDGRVAPYSRHGEWFAAVMAGLLAVALIYDTGSRLAKRSRRAAAKKRR